MDKYYAGFTIHEAGWLQVKAEKSAIIVPWTTINRVGLQEIDIRGEVPNVPGSQNSSYWSCVCKDLSLGLFLYQVGSTWVW